MLLIRPNVFRCTVPLATYGLIVIDRKEMNQRLVQLAAGPAIRFWRVDYNLLSTPERVFGVVWELESEVNNGGFYKYFWNGSGALARHSVEALKAIGARNAAGIAQEALTAVGDGIGWSDARSRRMTIGRLPPETKSRLNELDQAYYACPDDLTTLLYRYVSGHKREISAPADF